MGGAVPQDPAPKPSPSPTPKPGPPPMPKPTPSPEPNPSQAPTLSPTPKPNVGCPTPAPKKGCARFCTMQDVTKGRKKNCKFLKKMSTLCLNSYVSNGEKVMPCKVNVRNKKCMDSGKLEVCDLAQVCTDSILEGVHSQEAAEGQKEEEEEEEEEGEEEEEEEEEDGEADDEDREERLSAHELVSKTKSESRNKPIQRGFLQFFRADGQ